MTFRLGGVALTVVLGLLTIAAIAALFFVFNKTSDQLLLTTLLLTLAPLSLIFIFNWSGEALADKSADQLTAKAERMCLADKNGGFDGSFCSIYKIVEIVEQNIPQGATIAFDRPPHISPYFDYELVDRYKIVQYESADYVVLIASKNYSFQDGRLKKLSPDKEETLDAAYEPVLVMGDKFYILKKTN